MPKLGDRARCQQVSCRLQNCQSLIDVGTCELCRHGTTTHAPAPEPFVTLLHNSQRCLQVLQWRRTAACLAVLSMAHAQERLHYERLASNSVQATPWLSSALSQLSALLLRHSEQHLQGGEAVQLRGAGMHNVQAGQHGLQRSCPGE